MSMTSSKLLMSTKTMMADPNAPNSKNLLAQAARLVIKQQLKTVDIHVFSKTRVASLLAQHKCNFIFSFQYIINLFVPM